MKPTTQRKAVIGIIGGVGAGKSTVAAELARLGCALIDADRIGHDVLTRNDVREQLRLRWGEGMFGPDGSVDRDALGRAVFEDPRALTELNGILHPLIRQEGEHQLARCVDRPDIPAVVIDAPLLVEAGWDSLCTHLIYVRSVEEDRLQRVIRDRGWDKKKWQERESSQISVDTKARTCEYIIDNTSSVPHLVEQIRDILGRILAGSD